MDLPRWGIPCPARRKTRPFWVSGGIFSASLPFGVGTCTSPPRIATESGTGMVVFRLSPSRSKIRWGRTVISR